MEAFLPICRDDMIRRGWDSLDFIFVSGDAYVDHPSFGPALICRYLEAQGYRVGVIAQPRWREAGESEADFSRLGEPRLAWLVSSGNMDSSLNHYTAAKKRRHDDAYSPDGAAGRRPNHAVAVYVNRIREFFGHNKPVIIGGIEASLRRFTHYDYWSDAVRRSILADTAADILIYGMGERQVAEIAAELRRGTPAEAITDVPGTCFKVPNFDYIYDYLPLPSFAEAREDKAAFAAAFRTQYLEQDPFRGRRLAQQNGEWCVVQNPPMRPLTTAELDEIYALPFTRRYHPIYEAAGGVPALKEVEFSITGQRGCFGGCNFCAISMHQGRIVQARSHESIIAEAVKLTQMPNFKGYIHDLGGPTANFRQPSCGKQLKAGTCRDRSCLSPDPCPNLEKSQADLISLLRKLRRLPKVKKVFIRSGIRFDYLLLCDDEFLEELCRHHVSGQLKIAPEHISEAVTRLMGKSDRRTYLEFVRRFTAVNERLGKRQYLVPYFMSSHPGAGLEEAVELAEFLHEMRYRPQQVQDFIPTPGTLSTAMYHTGINPLTGEKAAVAKSAEDKRLQRALLQYWLPENRSLVLAALKKAGRLDLKGKLL